MANRTTVLTSTLLTVFALLAPIGLFSKPTRRWLVAGNDVGAPFWLKMRTALIWIPLAGALLGIVSPLLVLSVVAGSGIGRLVVWRRKKAKRQDAAEPSQQEQASRRGGDHLLWILATSVGLLLSQTLSSPWVPLEKVDITAGSSTVGYVIGEQAGRLLIVTREKEAIWVKDTDVSGRELCATSSGWLTSPIKDLVSTPKHRAACPRARDA